MNKQDYIRLKKLLEKIMWRFSLGVMGAEVREFIDKIDIHLKTYYPEKGSNKKVK